MPISAERRAEIEQISQQYRSGNVPKKKQEDRPGAFQSIAQGIAKPFGKFASSVAGIAEGAYDLARGDVKGANEALSRERDLGYFGKVRPIGITETGEQMGPVAGIKDIVGTGAELGSYVVGGGGVAGVGRATLGGAIRQGFKAGVQSGLIGGALQGGGAEAQRAGSTLGSIAGQTAVGAGIGGITGGVLGGTLPIVGASVSKVAGSLTPEGRIARIVSSNKKALDTLETGNSRVRNAFVNAERSGISDIKDRIVQENYLVGSVDNNGRIRTSKPNGGLSKIDALITPSEKVVSDNIEREGKMVSLDALEDYMMRNVQKSNIEGAAKKTALGKVASEIDGLRLDAVDNMIPLSKVQRLKIYKGRAINFADPDIQQADKSITNALKTFIEDNVDSIDVRTINKELSELYAIRDVLEALDGKVIKGGRLGKYFSQIIGATVGGHVGGPAGAVIGAEVGGRVQGGLLSRTLSQGTGKTPQVSKGMTEAISIGKSPLPKPPLIPESRRLPAPAIKTPIRDTSGLLSQADARARLRNLGVRIDDPQSNLGSRNAIQSNTPTAIRNSTISKTVPQIDINSVDSLNSEITRRLEKFRSEAGIVAQREGAGVRLRTPDNGLDTANTDTFTSFNLNRAKGNMKSQAESAKKYAQTMLYENDPEFRALVDMRDAVLETRIVEAKTVQDVDEVFKMAEKEERALINEVKQYESDAINETPSTPKENQTNGIGKEKGAGEVALLSEAKKYKTAEEFVRAPEFQYHISTEPNLTEGSKFSEQTTKGDIGARGQSGGEGIYTTNNPGYWHSQLLYEGNGEAPNNVYLVRVKKSTKGTYDAAHQDLNAPNDVIVVKNLGTVTEEAPFDTGLFESKKEKFLKNFWENSRK